ncbi:MAG: catalase HPII [Candidatus Eremiobacteraeota bacterium]|nr:catalase HPII [Candidatus Eremiobacteraeota bacterium]
MATKRTLAASPSKGQKLSDDLKSSEKTGQLDSFKIDATNADLRTNQGVPVADNQNSLRAGTRGPTLLEDFVLREKITHFDHERIPERVVHARGTGAHGYFQVYKSMAPYTRAHFLQDPSVKTPVFVRFSTVGGSRGSADTPRDVRGFAVKFYTQEGNYDLVGNNMPVFFIQDAIKFPDFVHAVKPEPHNEIPQASSAHDTLWDFVSLTLETSHMMMWLMSDRAIPKSLRMMEGFGVHTFRFINAKGESRFVKFHWKPLLGVHSLVWDEAQKLAGKDADFNRRDLYESIENGDYPEWEFGVQIFGDKEADSFDFDILDPTKLIPEELVPVERIGKMTLNRNPDNFFAETEQVAFCASHVVPGIDFTNDPLLQGRVFSYLDTQLSRLGGPNFHEIPINRPVCPFSNGQRDGLHRMAIDVGDTSYDPNSLDEGWPKERTVEAGAFATYPERMDGVKRRVRSESFDDHFSQATMFWNSMSAPEKEHIVSAFSFELAKVNRSEIRERVLNKMLANIDSGLSRQVATNLGLPVPLAGKNQRTDGAERKGVERSPALSQLNTATYTVKTRKVAILAADGVNAAAVTAMKTALARAGAKAVVLAARLGTLKGDGAASIAVDHTLITMPSVSFDAVVVPDGSANLAALMKSGDAVEFITETYKHGKAIAAIGNASALLDNVIGRGKNEAASEGIIVGESAEAVAEPFIAAIGRHRAWNRISLDAASAPRADRIR